MPQITESPVIPRCMSFFLFISHEYLLIFTLLGPFIGNHILGFSGIYSCVYLDYHVQIKFNSVTLGLSIFVQINVFILISFISFLFVCRLFLHYFFLAFMGAS